MNVAMWVLLGLVVWTLLSLPLALALGRLIRTRPEVPRADPRPGSDYYVLAG